MSKPKKERQGTKQEEPEIRVKIERFKLEDGREGSMAPIGNGLTKLLFDDGNMVIIRNLDE